MCIFSNKFFTLFYFFGGGGSLVCRFNFSFYSI